MHQHWPCKRSGGDGGMAGTDPRQPARTAYSPTRAPERGPVDTQQTRPSPAGLDSPAKRALKRPAPWHPTQYTHRKFEFSSGRPPSRR